jgi:hypothetical protein
MFYTVWGVLMLQLDLEITMALASCGANSCMCRYYRA